MTTILIVLAIAWVLCWSVQRSAERERRTFAALRVRCPLCGALPGFRCVESGGHPVHVARVRAGREAS